LHYHAIPSTRNSSLRAYLGDLPLPFDPGEAQAVADWAAATNASADQTALNALLLAGHAPAPLTTTSSTASSTPILWYLGIGLAAILLLEVTSRRR
jgi:hypothetical protein